MKNLLNALSEFQEKVPMIPKNKKGYGYKYADLQTIVKTVYPVLKKCGLVIHNVLSGRILKTVLTHVESGEYIVSEIEISERTTLKGMNDFQAFGSGLTYYRRYNISSILGIITEEDTDGVFVEKKNNNDSNPFKNCASLESLQNIYTAMSFDEKKKFKQLKDELKTKLNNQINN